MEINRQAKFQIGQIVRHRYYPFRGVIFDVDPTFNNTEEWWLSIPEEVRPRKDQPFYHLLAENADTEYVAYVSEQNLLADESGEPIRHPQVKELFGPMRDGVYAIRVRFDAPQFHRHDKVNGRRFAKGADVTFKNVKLKTGRE